MDNLSQLLLAQRERQPALMLGVAGATLPLEHAVETGLRTAQALLDSGLSPGDRIAVVAPTSTSYFLFWIGCQFAGLAPALVNPGYPRELLVEMLAGFGPSAVVSADGTEDYGLGTPVLGIAGLAGGSLRLQGRDLALPAAPEQIPGRSTGELDCAGFMHTSGTTGPPKFCAQSHRYFLRLGRFVVDGLQLTPEDRVLAPLPMFHINPLGYGFIGALTAGAHVTGLEHFKPEAFWAQASDAGSTVLILHAPPVQILKQRTSAQDARGHRVRTMFYADGEFLERYRIPAAVAGYGSTEAGGMTHMRRWRRGDAVPAASREAMSHFAGTSRPDVEWALSADGEIRIRAREPGVIFDGYWRDGAVAPVTAADGWFDTGDLGRADGDELVFVRRRSESIRVRGEFIPISYVEQRIAVACPELEIALWKVENGDASDELAVLYIAGETFPADRIRSAIATLPRFMRPVEAVRIATMPLDGGAGKVRRRLLHAAPVLDSCKL